MIEVTIPNTYEEWLGLLKSHAKDVLSEKSIEERVKALSNSNNPETIQFRSLYGDEHRQKIVAWFKRAAQESKN